MRQALEIDVTAFSEQHPAVARDLNNWRLCCRTPTASRKPSR